MSNLPLNFALNLAANTDAWQYFSSLTLEEQNQITNFMSDIENDEKEKYKLEIYIELLSKKDNSFVK